MTRSAMSSCSVGSLLMITSLAPLFLASIGKPAAGQTTSDDPIAINRSQCCASSVARRTASFVEALLDPWQVVRPSAADAAGVGGIAVKLDDVFGRKSRHLMQIVDVLGDDGGNFAAPVQRSERAVAASRPRRGEGRLHRKAPPPCLIPGILAGDEFIERNRAVASPQSAG